jgi:hypothetical protein
MAFLFVLAAGKARLPRNMSSFGADSKYGFDEGFSVFAPVTVESDMEFD